MKKLIIFCILILISVNANAIMPAMCSLSATDGMLDSFLQTYYNASQMWIGYLAPIAIKMFWFWFTCEFLWQLTFKKILTNDLQKLYIFFVVRIFTAYFFAQCFVNPDFYLGIIQYFTNLGAKAGGFQITPTSGNPFGAFSPSGIINIGLCSWNSLFAFLGANVGWTSVVNALIYALPMEMLTLLITFIAIVMAFSLVMLAIETYIVLFGAFILCGFAGSSWTQVYWQRYLSYIGGVAIRIFVMCLVLGIMETQLKSLFAHIVSASTGSDYVSLIGVFFMTLICMLMNGLIVLKVPSMAGSMLSGTVGGGLGDLMQGASMIMSGASLAKVFGSGSSKAISNLSQGAMALGTGGASLATSGISKLASAVSNTSTSSKTARDAVAKTTSMNQNTGNKTADQSPSSSTSSQADKVDALAKSAQNQVSGTINTNIKDNASSSANINNPEESNGIKGNFNTTTNPAKSTASKIKQAGQHLSKVADQAGRLSGSGHYGGAELNINPHKE